jgi:hypothetical protein
MEQPKDEVKPFRKKDGSEESDFLFFEKGESAEDAHARLDEKLGWEMPPLGDLEEFDLGGRQAFKRKA